MENQDVLITSEGYSGRQNRTICDRAFSSIQHGSLRGSVLNLCCTAIGAGCLTLSFAVDQAGLLPGVAILCIGALAAYWSLNNLILTSKEVHSTNYMVVCERAVGKWLGVVLEIIMILSLQGIIILYQIMCTVFISNKNNSRDLQELRCGPLLLSLPTYYYSSDNHNNLAIVFASSDKRAELRELALNLLAQLFSSSGDY